MNKRRSSTKNSRIKLPRCKVTKKDLKNLEKIIYKNISPADFYISIGRDFSIFGMLKDRYEFDSAKEVPERLIRMRPLVIQSKAPSIIVRFDRLSTILISGRVYRVSEERKSLDSLTAELMTYLSKQGGGDV